MWRSEHDCSIDAGELLARSVGSAQRLADGGGYFGAQEFDGVQHFGVGQGGYCHLEVEAADASEGFIGVEDFLDDQLRVADQEGSGFAAGYVVLGAGGGWPAAFFADLGEHGGVAGVEVVCGLLGGVAEEAQHVQADFEFFRGVAGAGSCFAIEVD